MAENKTRATEASVAGYLAAIQEEGRRHDCEALVTLMTRATGEPPNMWGTSIVGFGSYHYQYDSGREGDACLVGFSSRKGDISLYLGTDYPGRDGLLSRLGKHKLAKACLYLHKLSDIDLNVLEQLILDSAAARQRNHGKC